MGRGMRAGKRSNKKKSNKRANPQQQMAQIASMQKMMEEAQAEIEEMEVQTTSGGGAVSVTVGGDKQIKEIKLDPDIVDPDDIEMLQDLIMAATNEAIRQIEEKTEAHMSEATESLGLPPGLL